MSVRKERSGWRDEALSRRHREWGFDCPMVDIDFLTVEYDYSTPTALIEYKKEDANVNFDEISDKGASPQSYKALKSLSDNSNIPLLVIIYTNNLKQYYVIPMNEFAYKYVPQEIVLSELEYVALLYKMRRRQIPDNIVERIRKRDLSYFFR